jgi:hypothetical protein
MLLFANYTLFVPTRKYFPLSGHTTGRVFLKVIFSSFYVFIKKCKFIWITACGHYLGAKIVILFNTAKEKARKNSGFLWGSVFCCRFLGLSG